MRRALLLPLLLAAPAAAQLLAPASGLPPAAEAKWRQALAANEAALRAGKWDRAARGAQQVLDEIVVTIAHGEGSEPLLGRATLERAVARCGLGQERDAVWDYGVARALDAALGKADLAAYREAGRRLSELAEAEEKRFENASHGCTGVDCAGFVEQVPEVTPGLDFSGGTVERCSPGPYVVNCVVGEDGLLHLPVLAELREPTLAFLLLDALRAYRYRPATLAGRPVAVRFGVEVDFRLPACEGFR